VGFGDPGDLDEDLLRQIASGSGCGRYYYATDAYELDRVYLEVRHRALGQVVGEFSGQVAQGETTLPEQFTVPFGKGELNVTLVWPGSALDLIITDPKGRTVDENYPGATLATYARFVYLIIKNPLPGLWRMSVYGRIVPVSLAYYAAVASVRDIVGPITVPRVDSSAWVVALTLLAALGVAVFIAVSRQLGAGLAGAGVSIRQGYGPRGVIGFRRGVLGIGRDPRGEVVLSDEQVSRRHAQIRREPEGFVLYDQRSLNGTLVNGQPVERCALRNGDEIQVGDTHLTFHSRC
jgi:hypothetical protein